MRRKLSLAIVIITAVVMSTMLSSEVVPAPGVSQYGDITKQRSRHKIPHMREVFLKKSPKRAPPIQDVGLLPPESASPITNIATIHMTGATDHMYFVGTRDRFLLYSGFNQVAEFSRLGLSIMGGRNIISIRFVDSDASSLTGLDGKEATFSFFTSQTKEVGCDSYKSIIYEDLWPGIDLSYQLTPEGLKYEYLVAEGANPADICLEISGVSIGVSADGCDLYLGRLEDTGLIAYEAETGNIVDASWSVTGQQLSIELGNYEGALVIDPLIYSTYLGGVADDVANAVDVDENGSAYIVGTTQSTNFPTVPGSYNTTHADNSSTDVFVAKLSSHGNLLYATFLGGSTNGGGSGEDQGNGIAVDGSGSAYIAGNTFSADFPVTPGAYQTTKDTDRDVFVAKLSGNGTVLQYSTFIGGDGIDRGQGIDIDSSGYAYVAGWSGSTDYPTTSGVIDQTYNGNYDVIVSKVSQDGSSLAYSTYFGRVEALDRANDIDVDPNGRAHVCGWTESTFFLATDQGVTRGYDRSHSGGGDREAYALCLSADASAVEWGSYVAGIGVDHAWGVVADDVTGTLTAVVGEVRNGNLHTTPSSYNTTYGGSGDAYCVMFGDNGSQLEYGTYIGEKDADVAYDIRLNGQNRALLVGHTYSEDFPTSYNANDTTHNGMRDGFVARLSGDGQILGYSTFMGGGGMDSLYGVAYNASNYAFVVGESNSSGAFHFITEHPLQATNNGSYDAVVTSFYLGVDPLLSILEAPFSVAQYTNFSIVVNATASDTPLTGVNITFDGVEYEMDNISLTRWNWTQNQTSIGVKIYSVQAWDEDGDSATLTGLWVEVGGGVPSISLLSADPVDLRESFTVYVNVTDTIPAPSGIAWVKLEIGGVNHTMSNATTGDPWNWTWFTFSLAGGNHSFRIIATDESGATNTSAHTASIGDLPTISSVVAPDSLYRSQVFSLEARVTDATLGDTGVAWVNLTIGGVVHSMTNSTGRPTVFEYKGLPTSISQVEGASELSWSIVASDNAGNTQTYISTLEVLPFLGESATPVSNVSTTEIETKISVVIPPILTDRIWEMAVMGVSIGGILMALYIDRKKYRYAWVPGVTLSGGLLFGAILSRDAIAWPWWSQVLIWPAVGAWIYVTARAKRKNPATTPYRQIGSGGIFAGFIGLYGLLANWEVYGWQWLYLSLFLLSGWGAFWFSARWKHRDRKILVYAGWAFLIASVAVFALAVLLGEW